MSEEQQQLAEATTIDTAVRIIEPQTETNVERVRSMRINTRETYEKAAQLRVGVSALLDEIEATRVRLKAPALATCKEIDATFREKAAPLIEARTELDRKLVAFDTAERKRIEKLEREREEKARKEAEERRKLEIEAAEDETEKEILEAAPVIPDPTPVAVNRTSGTTALKPRSQWSAEVTNKLALVKAVAEGTVPIEAVNPNLPYLNRAARALRSTSTFPGVKFNERKTMSR